MKKTLTKLGVGMLLLGGTIPYANAVDFNVDYLTNNLGEVTINGSGKLTSPGDYYTFDSTVSGTITLETDVQNLSTIGYPNYGSGGYSTYFFFQVVVETEETYLMQVYASDYTQTSNGYNFEFNVSENNTYVIGYPDGNGLDMEEGFSFTVVGEQGPATVAIKSVDPAPSESSINYTVISDVIITASKSIESISGGTLTYGDNQSIALTVGVGDNLEVNGPPSSQFIQFRAQANRDGSANLLEQIANSGADSFTLTIDDVTAGGVLVTENETNNELVTVENGTVKITYNIEQAPQYLADQSTWPTTFLSYWPEGDEAAKATLVFSKNIESIDVAKVIMGQSIPGSSSGENNDPEYSLEGHYTIDGTKVILDFSGVERIGTKSTVTVGLSNVMGENGLAVNFGDNGTNFVKYLPYQKVEEEPSFIANPLENLTEDISINEIPKTAQVTWGVPVEILSDNAVVEVSKDGEKIGELTSSDMALQARGESKPSTGIETLAAGNMDEILNLVLTDLATEVGTYTLSLPQGLVQDADGNINKAETIEVNVVASNLVEGKVSPETDYEFQAGEEVIITISYDGTVEQNSSPDAPLMVFANLGEAAEAGYDETFTWDDEELSISGNDVVINLGTELKQGEYMLTFRQGQVVVDGVENEMVDYTFSVAAAAPAPTWQTVTLEKPFEASQDNPAWIIEPNEYSGPAYIVSNNPTNLIDEGYKLLFLDDTMERAYDVEAVEGEDGNYIYTIDNLNLYYPAYFYYYGAEEISFTLYNEEYKSGEEEDNDVLTFGDKATFDFLSTTTVQFQTRVDGPTSVSAISNSPENNASYIKLIVPSQLAGLPDTELTPTAIQMQDGNIAYYFENVGTSVMTFQFYSFSGAVTITFQQGKVEGTVLGGDETIEATPIELDKEFTATEKTAWSYIDEEGDGYEVYLLSDSDVNLIAEGLLTLKVAGADVDWDAVADANGIYGYNGTIQAGLEYVFTYYGTESVNFTLKKGTYTENGEPKFLAPATCLNTTINVEEGTPVVILTWGVDVTLDETKSVNVWHGDDMLAPLDATLMEVKEGENGTDLYLNFGNDDTFNKGAGTYTFILPAGLVSTADGYINDAQTIEVSVSGEWTGVSGIEAEAAQGGVYNLQGVKVADSVKNLNNGIYIINGKKVMIRK